jgi:NitT/TauT family transport system permease protein
VSARAEKVLLPLAVVAVIGVIWSLGAGGTGVTDFPSPGRVFGVGFRDLLTAREGEQVPRLVAYSLASVFRVTWGFLLAAAIAIPLGLVMGWYLRWFRALNPLIQFLRPISPIAWIPIAILIFRNDDPRSIFLIFISTFFPIVVSTTAAVRNIPQVYIRSAGNFGCRGWRLFKKVVLPAALPQILTGLRIAVGIAWLVVVAAEMIAVESGLGYLIIDARNMGGRYDLVVAAMIVIGLIGVVLDYLIRKLETSDEVKWGYARRG